MSCLEEKLLVLWGENHPTWQCSCLFNCSDLQRSSQSGGGGGGVVSEDITLWNMIKSTEDDFCVCVCFHSWLAPLLQLQSCKRASCACRRILPLLRSLACFSCSGWMAVVVWWSCRSASWIGWLCWQSGLCVPPPHVDGNHNNNYTNNNKALVDTDAAGGGQSRVRGGGVILTSPPPPQDHTHLLQCPGVQSADFCCPEAPPTSVSCVALWGGDQCVQSETDHRCATQIKTQKSVSLKFAWMRFGTLWFYIIGLNWSQWSQCPVVS